MFDRAVRDEIGGDLGVAAALFGAGLLCSDDIPWVAADALAGGVDSDSLRRLAGLSALDAAVDAGTLLEAALEELGQEPARPRPAKLLLARCTARGILDGSISPRRGAREIYVVLGGWDDADCADLGSVWCTLDDQYDWPDDCGPSLEELDTSVREAAGDLLANADDPSS